MLQLDLQGLSTPPWGHCGSEFAARSRCNQRAQQADQDNDQVECLIESQ
jgi:hypothetical protein